MNSKNISNKHLNTTSGNSVGLVLLGALMHCVGILGASAPINALNTPHLIYHFLFYSQIEPYF
jgi:hypothetical protein